MSSISDRADIGRVLMQMRDIQSQLNAQQIDSQPIGRPGALEGLRPTDSSDKSSFGNLLKQAVDSVNETQLKASALQDAYQLGDKSVDITQVMIQMQKSSVAFEAMTQVRNRVVRAYQDIMNMPV